MSSNREEVDALLEMYQRYKVLLAEQSAASSRLAKAKLLKRDYEAIESEYREITTALQDLSDAMTFANPSIWMAYKYEAYRDESQPIRTMHDFRVHCSKPGYICTKRFIFLNDWLTETGNAPLADQKSYPDDMLLDAAYESKVMNAVSTDPAFLERWAQHEYHHETGRVAKWANYEGSTATQA